MTSLTKLTSSEPAGLELGLEPVLYVSCLFCSSSSSSTGPALPPHPHPRLWEPPWARPPQLRRSGPASPWSVVPGASPECCSPPPLPGPRSFLLSPLPSPRFLSLREAGWLWRGQVPSRLKCHRTALEVGRLRWGGPGCCGGKRPTGPGPQVESWGSVWRRCGARGASGPSFPSRGGVAGAEGQGSREGIQRPERPEGHLASPPGAAFRCVSSPGHVENLTLVALWSKGGFGHLWG